MARAASKILTPEAGARSTRRSTCMMAEGDEEEESADEEEEYKWTRIPEDHEARPDGRCEGRGADERGQHGRRRADGVVVFAALALRVLSTARRGELAFCNTLARLTKRC